MRISIDHLRRLYADVARWHGAGAEEAGIFADGLLKADLRGHHTQGIGLLPYLDELYEAGALHFARPFTVERESAATALVDGHGGCGHFVGHKAMEIAIAKAEAAGIGFVTVKRSGDYGMASNYALQALERGMIGLSMSTGPVLVAPWGGRDAYFCTNPLALAVPSGKEDPIVIDMATSAGSMGKVVLAARDGKRLDEKAVVDQHGVYTDDPLRVILDVMDRESRMSGALLPAGPKGFGMMLIVELLSALLSGERDWQGERPADPTGRAAYYAHSFIAIDVARFQDPAAFAAAADRMIATLTGARPAQGFEAVRLPGGGAAATERDYRANGIRLRDEEWAMVEATARKRGIVLATDAHPG
ncbi:Ldh family oxidoreductase [Ancylobacter oerskovii]|uniref:Ldh family oxidoreductase n=1 Tax=Ancylobacter oerskovii TaxID=459519 RepID=A0ABW4Z066_9HYPH|nr:Ldh family oxidoreductase [Ancylobacter oerskovii]MBS7542910.1 Ldh family oxidoreductase [Ancylobacter oerskovii]